MARRAGRPGPDDGVGTGVGGGGVRRRVRPGPGRALLPCVPHRGAGSQGAGAGGLRRARRRRHRGRRRSVGAHRPQAAARHDAAGRPAAPRGRGPRAVSRLARGRARRRRGREPRPGAPRRAPPHHPRVPQRRAQPPRPRGRRGLAAVPARRREPGGVQHRRRGPLGVAGPVRPLSLGRQPYQPARGGRPRRRPRVRRRHLLHAAVAVPGRPHERGPALRVPRGIGGPALLPARRRVPREAAAAPDDLRLHRGHGDGPAGRGPAGRAPRAAVHCGRRRPLRVPLGLHLLRHHPRRPGVGAVRVDRRRRGPRGHGAGHRRRARRRGVVRGRAHRADGHSRAPAVRLLAERARLLPRARGHRAGGDRRPLRPRGSGRHREPAPHLHLPARRRRGRRRCGRRRRRWCVRGARVAALECGDGCCGRRARGVGFLRPGGRYRRGTGAVEFHSRTGHGRCGRGGPLRARDPVNSGAARLSPAARRPRSGHAARVLRAGPRRGGLRGRHPEGHRAPARGPRVPVPHRARPARRAAGDRVPAERPGAGVPPLAVPVERHPRRAAARGGRGRPPLRPGRARPAGRAHARRSPSPGPRRELREPVAAARPGEGVIPDADVFWDFDENLRADMERETALFLESQILGDRGVMELFDPTTRS